MSDEVKDQAKEVKPEEKKAAAPAADGAAAAPKAEEKKAAAPAKKEEAKPKEEPAAKPAEDEYDDEYWDDIEEEEAEEARKRKIKIVVGIIVAVIVVAALACYIYVSKLGKYNDAVGLYEAEQYADAAVAFEDVGTFRDAARMAQKSYYEVGGQALLAGDFDAAKEAFAAAGDYDNAVDMLTKVDYRKAISLLNAGEGAAAAAIFAEMIGYNQSDMYLEWANAEAKYANYDPNANLYGDGFADWRAAEAGLAATVYGTWYTAEGEELAISSATIGDAAYTIDAAEGFGANVSFAGALADGTAYTAVVTPVFTNPAVNKLTYNGVEYCSVTPDEYAAILEAKANGEYAEEELAEARYSGDTVINKALDKFVAIQKAEEPVVEAEAVEGEEAVEAAPSLKDKLLALVPAHYDAKDATVSYDTATKVYDVAFTAVYIENALAEFKSKEAPAYSVTAQYVDTGAGLKELAFAYGDVVEAEEAPAEEAVEAPAEEAPAEEAVEAPEEEAPAEEAVEAPAEEAAAEVEEAAEEVAAEVEEVAAEAEEAAEEVAAEAEEAAEEVAAEAEAAPAEANAQ